VSEQLQMPMLIGCDFCVTNDIILNFQREKLMIQNGDESTEVEIMNSREVRVEDCYDSLRNRQVFALPTGRKNGNKLLKIMSFSKILLYKVI
jgi:hypothetical protein